MSALARRHYSDPDVNHWLKYQPFLPESLRLTPAGLPVEQWWSWRGAEIHLDRFTAADAPLTVILCHGGGGCGRLLAPYGQMLEGHGYEVVAPDLPGYGLSIAPPDLFSYHAWVDCVADLAAAEHQRTGRPVVLFGMSVGGYLAYLAAAKGRLAAGVIATTLADPRLPIVRDQFARNPRLNRLLLPALPLVASLLGGLRLPIKWFSNMQAISNNAELNCLLCSDPVAGGNRASLRFMNSLFTIKPAIEPEAFDVCPVLLAHPAADRWTTIEASQPFFDRIKAPKELVMLENCGHFPIESPGVERLEEAVLGFLKNLPRGAQKPAKIAAQAK